MWVTILEASRRSPFGSIFLTMFFLPSACYLCDAQTTAPTRQNSTDNQLVDADQSVAINKILDGKNRLSCDNSSASSRFWFVIEASKLINGDLEKSFDVAVVRQDDDCAILARYPNGSPNYYSRKGLALLFDPTVPRILVFRKGAPVFKLLATDRSFQFDSGHDAGHDSAVIEVDFASLIRPRLAIAAVQFDPLERVLKMSTPHTYQRFYLSSARSDDFAIEAWRMSDSDKRTLEIRQFHFGGKRPPIKLNLDTETVSKSTGLMMVSVDSDMPATLPEWPVLSSLADQKAQTAAQAFNKVVFDVDDQAPRK